MKYDKEQFTHAIMQIKDQAYRIAFCYLHNEADSMDAVCDAVEKAYINMDKLKNDKVFKTWFMSILINECRQKLRADRKLVLLPDSVEVYAPDTDTDARMDLESLLRELPAADRILIYMKYYLGYTLEEIAQSMNMPCVTIKTKLYGSLKKLKIRLEAEEVQVDG